MLYLSFLEARCPIEAECVFDFPLVLFTKSGDGKMHAAENRN